LRWAQTIEVNVLLRLGNSPATDVPVQAYYGIMNAGGSPELGTPQNLELYPKPEKAFIQYRGSIAFPHSGQWGFLDTSLYPFIRTR
jgi:hypothetical protein